MNSNLNHRPPIGICFVEAVGTVAVTGGVTASTTTICIVVNRKFPFVKHTCTNGILFEVGAHC